MHRMMGLKVRETGLFLDSLRYSIQPNNLQREISFIFILEYNWGIWATETNNLY